jgi:two-component system, NtrC family, sensor kinase
MAKPAIPTGGADTADLVNQARLATLGMLVAGLAHEINTPLGALNSNHDVLRRALGRLQAILADEVVEPHELDEVRRVVRAVDGILKVNDMAVERMTSLVTSLRNFGRLDRAEIDFADLHEGIESTLAIIAHELRDVTVVREFGTLPTVECHPHQINQVVMNLLLNARHAMPDGGTITIRTWAEGDQAFVRITDTGTGMDAATASRIFEPGFTTKQGRIGMGLGLLICRQILDRHGGDITVDTEPGTGSSFTVRLPVRSPHAHTVREAGR